jgi:hypothetical protein
MVPQRHVAAEDVNVYDDLLSRQTAVFVEEELGTHFQALISFVRTTEADIHAMALSSGRAGVGAGAGGGGGGGRAEGSGKLPEGIVPRVDHAVAV